MANSRPFMDFLREHGGGATHDELSDLLQTVVQAVTSQEKSGSLTVTFTIKPVGKSGGLEVSADIKTKLPKAAPGASIFFATPDNNLVRQDPRQQNLELREIGPAFAARGLA